MEGELLAECMKPAKMFVVILLSIFGIEALLMIYLEPLLIAEVGGIAFGLIDSLLLATLASAVIYKYQLLPQKKYLADAIDNNTSLAMAGHIFEHGTEAVLVVDREWNQVFSNSAFETLFSLVENQASGVSLALLLGERSAIADLKHVMASDHFWDGELNMVTAQGESFPAEIRITMIPMYQREEDRYVITINDVTDKVQARSDIDFLTRYDPATTLPNEFMLHQFIDDKIASNCKGCLSPAACSDCPTRGDARFALAVYRLRGLSNVTDVYGRAACNSLVCDIAEDLIKFTDASSVARLSMNEFAIIISDYFDADDVQYKLDKLGRIIGSEHLVMGNRISLRYECGYSEFPGDGQSSSEVVANSMLALHAANSEAETFVSYTRSMLERIHEDELIRRELRQAVKHMDFDVVYQPQTRIEDGQLVGVEALLRWKMSDGTPVSPVKFIPELERMGVIYDVGLWVMKHCCAQGQSWLDQGMPKFSMAVNISALQLLNNNFARDVLEVLSTTHFPATMLELELTESCMVQDPAAAEQLMHDLGSIGVQIAIDDFGTGYSSLAYLKRFTTLDKLKIDKSFVDSIAGGEENVITNAIISLAKSLNLKAIAEGVEDQSQADYLRKHGCDEIQGYLISKPLEAEQMAEYASNAGMQNSNVIKLMTQGCAV